ncbi:MAG: sarcosine oxidase subunit gamma family protein [Gemmobacter sp.]|nr:sarcosine oxidase subunit gamma family protein [Gemmobacter sp.]
MSDLTSPLGGKTAQGYVLVKEIGPVGMITLRCNLADPALAPALAALSMDVPGVRRMEIDGDRAAGWMSPDELLLILPYAEVAQALRTLAAKLVSTHHLAQDVSDARAVFCIQGAAGREVLAKLCPVDLSPATFGAGDLRRTRAAQVAAAFWLSGPDEITLVSFRSVAGYVMAVLEQSSLPGSEIGLFGGA